MKITTLGIDLAKRVFQLHGVDRHGKSVLTKRLSRKQLLPFIANLPACVTSVEACGGAHCWARECRHVGHEINLISPQYIKLYIKAKKKTGSDPLPSHLLFDRVG